MRFLLNLIRAEFARIERAKNPVDLAALYPASRADGSEIQYWKDKDASGN